MKASNLISVLMGVAAVAVPNYLCKPFTMECYLLSVALIGFYSIGMVTSFLIYKELLKKESK